MTLETEKKMLGLAYKFQSKSKDYMSLYIAEYQKARTFTSEVKKLMNKSIRFENMYRKLYKKVYSQNQ
tara:strand:- start:266 stop:469 length:204 start_codon:yes stop_codon:yes gene_type:complete